MQAQLEATAPLLGEDMDVLLWPEGGVDSDPTANASTAAVLDALSERIDAPLIVSAVTARGDEYFNSSLLWKAGEGAVQTLRQAASGAVRRVRARPGVLRAVRAGI